MMKHKHFPLFLNIENKKAVVIGGGKIALRRINTLLKFDLQLTVVSPRVEEEIINLAHNKKLNLLQKEYQKEDLQGAFLAIAATNQREINHQIGVVAKSFGIFVSVADCKDECDFFFPAIITEEEKVIAIAGDGSDHKSVAQTASKIREIF